MSRAVRITNILVVVIPFVAFVAALATLWNAFVGPLDLAIAARDVHGHAPRRDDRLPPLPHAPRVPDLQAGRVRCSRSSGRWRSRARSSTGSPTTASTTRTPTRRATRIRPSRPGAGVAGRSRACGTRTSAGCGTTTASPSAPSTRPTWSRTAACGSSTSASARSRRCRSAIPFGLGWAIGGSLHAGLTAFLWGGLVRSSAAPRHLVDQLDLPLLRPPPLRHDGPVDNVFWLALPSFGEAWHHNHHAFPRSASTACAGARSTSPAGSSSPWRSSGSSGTSCE